MKGVQQSQQPCPFVVCSRDGCCCRNWRLRTQNIGPHGGFVVEIVPQFHVNMQVTFYTNSRGCGRNAGNKHFANLRVWCHQITVKKGLNGRLRFPSVRLPSFYPTGLAKTRLISFGQILDARGNLGQMACAGVRRICTW